MFEGYSEDIAIPSTWENISYKNDTCPSWLINGFQVFIDHPIPEQRECKTWERFLVTRIESESAFSGVWAFSTDSWDEVLETIEKPLYCEWNDSKIQEVHSELSLYEKYKDTNLYDGEATWGDGYNFMQILYYLKDSNLNIGRKITNDNMTITRLF